MCQITCADVINILLSYDPETMSGFQEVFAAAFLSINPFVKLIEMRTTRAHAQTQKSHLASERVYPVMKKGEKSVKIGRTGIAYLYNPAGKGTSLSTMRPVYYLYRKHTHIATALASYTVKQKKPAVTATHHSRVTDSDTRCKIKLRSLQLCHLVHSGLAQKTL